jgi:hypothetical protein
MKLGALASAVVLFALSGFGRVGAQSTSFVEYPSITGSGGFLQAGLSTSKTVLAAGYNSPGDGGGVGL